LLTRFSATDLHEQLEDFTRARIRGKPLRGPVAWRPLSGLCRRKSPKHRLSSSGCGLARRT
jgi:hypothetical protein